MPGDEPARRNPTKSDVAIEEIRQKYAFRRSIVSAFTVCGGITTSAIPVYFVYGMVSALAGKDTKLSLNAIIGLTVAGSLVLGGTGWAAVTAWLKNRRQKEELERLRVRCTELEQRVMTLSRPALSEVKP